MRSLPRGPAPPPPLPRRGARPPPPRPAPPSALALRRRGRRAQPVHHKRGTLALAHCVILYHTRAGLETQGRGGGWGSVFRGGGGGEGAAGTSRAATDPSSCPSWSPSWAWRRPPFVSTSYPHLVNIVIDKRRRALCPRRPRSVSTSYPHPVTIVIAMGGAYLGGVDLARQPELLGVFGLVILGGERRRSVQGSVAVSRCTAAHPLYTIFTDR